MQGQEHLQLLLTERGWKRETVHANTICPRPTKNLQTKTPRFKFVKSWIKLRTRCRIADDAIRKLWRNPTISGPAAGRANRQQPATHQFVRPLRHRRFVAGRSHGYACQPGQCVVHRAPRRFGPFWPPVPATQPLLVGLLNSVAVLVRLLLVRACVPSQPIHLSSARSRTCTSSQVRCRRRRKPVWTLNRRRQVLIGSGFGSGNAKIQLKLEASSTYTLWYLMTTCPI